MKGNDMIYGIVLFVMFIITVLGFMMIDPHPLNYPNPYDDKY